MELSNTLYHQILVNSVVCHPEGKNFDLRNRPVICRDRDSQIVEFCPPEDVSAQLNSFLNKFEKLWQTSHSRKEIAKCCATFWFWFIWIHPFINGNGRTAKETLKSILPEKGYEISNYELIDRYLLKFDSESEIEDLTKLFIISIRKI